MIEFFEKNLGFLILVTIVASFVIWSVKKEGKEEKKKAQEKKDAQKKAEESQKNKDEE